MLNYAMKRSLVKRILYIFTLSSKAQINEFPSGFRDPAYNALSEDASILEKVVYRKTAFLYKSHKDIEESLVSNAVCLPDAKETVPFA